VADRLVAVAGVVLTLAGVGLLTVHWTIMLELRFSGLLALLLFVTIASAIDHCLGGPNPDNRTTLAIACATRHVGAALVVADMLHGPGAPVLITAYVVASTAVSIAYLRWRRHHVALADPAQGRVP
jgi:BASS family bile acid:Na+ symporter